MIIRISLDVFFPPLRQDTFLMESIFVNKSERNKTKVKLL